MDDVAKPAEQPFDQALRDKARNSWTFGIAAVILAMLACGSYITVLIALPLGIMATSNARAVLASPDLDGVSEVYARTGQITGLAAALWSGLVLLLLLAFIVLYGGMFAMVFAANL
ncbi:MAG: hypothetical protein R3F59_07925 [Myxococcota bacterium]